MCWRHVATRLVNRKSTEHKMARLVFGFSPESSVGFGRFFAAVCCKAKPTEKHRVEPVFGFVVFGQPKNRHKKVGSRSLPNPNKNPPEKNDFRCSVHNPAQGIVEKKTASELASRFFSIQQFTSQGKKKQVIITHPPED